MTERLDRIEAAIERNTATIDRNAAAIDRNFASINLLVGGFESVSNRMSQMLDIMQQTETERQAAEVRANQMMETIRSNQQKIAENENRFETLLAENRADRLAWRQQIAEEREERERQLAEEREERQRQLAEEREERQRQFDAQVEAWRRRDEEWQRQMAAQNQVVQALLMQIANNNDRINRLEAS